MSPAIWSRSSMFGMVHIGPYVPTLYNRWLSSGDSMSDKGEDWEEAMLNKMAEMFKQMGLEVDISTLRGMMSQFQRKFEEMGFDPEKIAKDGINLNFDMSSLKDMLGGGGNLNDMLSNLGFDVKVDAKPAEVDVPTEDDGEAALKELPEPEIYLDGWEMFITVDCTKQVELEEEQMELELVEKGSLLEVLKETQASPVARIELPHACDKLVGWSLNNGILDVTLKLTPPGADFDEDDDEGDDDDDDIIEVPDVSIDLSDDDEGEDGGIPIF
jgi:hypothetical protein